ncbi:GGDEF domain-containing response regulator [Paraglaciecola aestuariivivens]
MTQEYFDDSTFDMSLANILLVDDDSFVLSVLKQALKDFKNVHCVTSGAQAITFCNDSPPDLVVLDVMMPELNGLETCRMLRTIEGMQDCPIIFSTSLDSLEDELKCWEAGGTDFVLKPIVPMSLIKRIQAHIRLKFQSDAQKELAIIDSLTGLRNRRFFDDYYQQLLNLSIKTNTDMAIIVIDIDYFKQYNDTYGHVQGDFCLQLVAKVIAQQINRPTDIAVRYGGEEFAILLPNNTIDGARTVANQLISQLKQQAIPHNSSPLGIVTASAGIASLCTLEEGQSLFGVADKRLFSVKNSGRNAYA